jgi:hypothetical protein
MAPDRQVAGGQASPAERGIGTPKESSAEGQQPKEKAAPVSETGKQDQERQKPPRDNAAMRVSAPLDMQTVLLVLIRLAYCFLAALNRMTTVEGFVRSS